MTTSNPTPYTYFMKNNTTHLNTYHPSLIAIGNNGQDIANTNYWQTDWARLGLMYLSINAGAFRLLIPPQLRHTILDMKRGARYVVVTRGQMHGRDIIEWLVEDNSSTPYVCYIETKACDRLFAQNDSGRKAVASVWDCTNGQPHKCFELPAYCQNVNHLPCLKRINH